MKKNENAERSAGRGIPSPVWGEYEERAVPLPRIFFGPAMVHFGCLF